MWGGPKEASACSEGPSSQEMAHTLRTKDPTRAPAPAASSAASQLPAGDRALTPCVLLSGEMGERAGYRRLHRPCSQAEEPGGWGDRVTALQALDRSTLSATPALGQPLGQLSRRPAPASSPPQPLLPRMREQDCVDQPWRKEKGGAWRSGLARPTWPHTGGPGPQLRGLQLCDPGEAPCLSGPQSHL